MTNISFFTKYPTQGATSRYRSFAFAAELAENNYNVEIESFMPINYLADLFAKRPKKKLKILFSYLLRSIAVLRSSDLLIIERELFPYLPYGIEKWFLKGKKYILDYDDNVWEDYRGKRFLEFKYDYLVKNAAGVIVGNHFLKESVQNLNSNVLYIPTVVNLERYRIPSVQKSERFSLVWIGSSVTYRYIKAFAPIFQKASKQIDFDLVIIASKQLESEKIDGVSMIFHDWSSETETLLLQQCHVGIMPLSDDPFSQGKSGFKLIQYQASGLPMIASPVGENNHIIEQGKNGYLAASESEWIMAIETLASDIEQYAYMSAQSQERSYPFSFQYSFPIYQKFIDKTFTKTYQ
ncbi:MAG: glycosyltransferase family 4 protein [Sulfuricurvum sp.]|nr:glycosyltransferase family 4 protein [Sulfuricurvum sp.]